MVGGAIRGRYESLTDNGKKIADYVLSHPEQASRMTIRELAGACGTAQSAVTRFCRGAGYESFQAMKLGLAAELAESPPEPLPAFGRDDSAETVFRKVFSSGVQTLTETLKLLDFKVIRGAADAFSAAGRILFFGVGTSAVVAQDAQYRFGQLGLNAVSCTDILFMNVAAANLHKGDAAVGISHSGETRATVAAMRHAKEAGAVTVAITSHAGSRLYREADFPICAFSDDQNYPVEAVSARVAHICVIDAFMMTLATMDYDAFAAKVAARNKVLREIRY